MVEDDRNQNGHALSRRAALAGAAMTGAAITGAATLAGTPLPAQGKALQGPARPEDEKLMAEAIALAAEADFPFGAVIARDGAVLARGFNMGKRLKDPTAHGEMVAIRHFIEAHGANALKGTTLYTSGEPCVMCMGAIIWSGIGRVVYAASIAELSLHLGQIMISCTEIAEKAAFRKVEITGGVLADEALKLFKS